MAKNGNPQPEPVTPELSTSDGTVSSFDFDYDKIEWEEASSIIWKPEVGETLQGMVEGFLPFDKGQYTEPVLQWYISASDGVRYSMVGGQVFDRQMHDANIAVGDLVRILYKGKRTTPKGQSMNDWRIQYYKLTE